MGPGEVAVLQAAVARGYISHQQVEEARKIADQLKTAGGVLAVLSERYLSPAQREEMRKVWRDASGQEATRADEQTVPPPGMMEATLPPPGSAVPGEEFDSRGDTLAPQRGATELGTLPPAPAVFVPETDPQAETDPELPPHPEPDKPLLSPSGRYDPTAATIIEPAGPGLAPPLPAHDDFRSAQTLMEGEHHLRNANTIVEDNREKTVEQISKGPEQTEVARRSGTGQTRPDEPHSRQNLSGVEPSLLSRGGGGAAKAPPRKIGPERIGKFKVVRELGRGGMGVVYEARDEYLDRPVALKVLIGGLSASDQAVQRFRIEGLAAERLKHENVVQVIELGQDPHEGNWYMAMELIRGISLKEKIEKNGPLDEATSIRYTKQLAKALGFAHEQNVLHRDVKPHNVLLDPQDVPKLTDFGLAKLVGDHQHSMTATGPSVMGTPGFMPPEQAGASTKPADNRADVYSLGATLFYMLTGRAPFQDDSVARVLMAVVKNPPPLPSTLRPGLSHDLETIILKCLEKKPEDRYADMAALEEDLQRFIDARQIVAKRPGPLLRLSRWVAANQVSAVGLSLLTLACSGFLAREILREPPGPQPWIGPGNGGKPSSGSIGVTGSETPVGPPPWEWAGPPWDGVVVEPTRDKRSPTLTPRQPEPETVVGVPEVDVRVEAFDDSGTVARVQLEAGKRELTQDPTAPEGTYAGKWFLEDRDGEQTTTVSAVDTSGNVSEITLKVTLDQVKPTLQVLAPIEEEVTTEETQVRVSSSEPVRLEARWGVSNAIREQFATEHAFVVRLVVDQEVSVTITVRDRAGWKTDVTRRLKRIEHPWLRGDGSWLPCPAQRAAASASRPALLRLDGLGLRLVLIPGGAFARAPGQAPVTISRSFYLGATEVTNAQLRAFDPDHTSGDGLDGPDQPAVNVTWAQAVEFCAWLTKQRGQVGPVRLRYRLPSEAEWELAARGCTEAEWWLEEGGREGHIYVTAKGTPRLTRQVGKLAGSPVGLYDVLGNAEEWCLDAFADSLPLPGTDPLQSEFSNGKKDHHPTRGGSHYDALEICLPSRRKAWAKTDAGVGFRVLAEIVE